MMNLLSRVPAAWAITVCALMMNLPDSPYIETSMMLMPVNGKMVIHAGTLLIWRD